MKYKRDLLSEFRSRLHYTYSTAVRLSHRKKFIDISFLRVGDHRKLIQFHWSCGGKNLIYWEVGSTRVFGGTRPLHAPLNFRTDEKPAPREATCRRTKLQQNIFTFKISYAALFNFFTVLSVNYPFVVVYICLKKKVFLTYNH